MTATQTRPCHMGFDVGGTQTSYMGDHSPEIFQVRTSDFASLEELIIKACLITGTPEEISVCAAGIINPDGSVKLTNNQEWPAFHPRTFGASMGCKVSVFNDMAAKAAGLLTASTSVVFAGKPVENDRKTVITVSSGVNHATLLPNGSIFETEGGHVNPQPSNEKEWEVIKEIKLLLGTRYVSVEQIIGGKHFFKLYDAMMASGNGLRSKKHCQDIETCHARNTGIGPFISSHAMQKEPFCERFMSIVGSMLGQYLRAVALTTLPRAGIYLTGGVMQQDVVDYLFNHTALRDAFLGGSEHNDWLGEVPIYLVTDEHLGVKGALQLAMTAS